MRLSLPAGAVGLVSLALSAAAAQAAGPACSPLAFGAAGDGVTDNTNAIQSAIDACEATYGGGVVRLSAEPGKGTYLTGPIRLANHIRLQLDKGVTLLGSRDPHKYKTALLDQPFQANEALIWANQVIDTGIIGPGTIDGQGGLPALDGPDKSAAPAAGVATSDSVPRPWLVEFYQCKGVTVNDVTLANAPMRNLVLRYSQYITVSELSVQGRSGPIVADTDGIDLVGSSDATLIFLNINSGGDAIALKSGLRPGDPLQQPTHDIQILNSRFTGGNGIVIGGDAADGVYNVIAKNLTETGSAHGLQIKADLSGGRRSKGDDYNIWVENMALTGVSQPLSIGADGPSADGAPELANPPRSDSYTRPAVHDITLKNITANDATQASRIVGLPDSCIHNVVLENVKITSQVTGLQLRDMTGTFNNTLITSTSSGSPIELGGNVAVATAGTTPAIAELSPTSCRGYPNN